MKIVKLLIAPSTFGTSLNIIYPYMWVRGRNGFFIMYIIEANTDFYFDDFGSAKILSSIRQKEFLIFISLIT